MYTCGLKKKQLQMKNKKTNLITLLIYVSIILISVFVISNGNSSNASEIGKASLFMPSDTAIVWEKMSFDERKNYMKKVVMPTMYKEFNAFDSTRFSAMNCRTCHGSGVKAGDFKMPNSRIPKLTMNFEEMAHDNPNYMKFMASVVKPKMAELLGQQPISHDEQGNQTGTFGCQSCHMFEEAPTK